MANNGIDVGLPEFKRMRSLDRDISIYRNLRKINKRLEDYQSQIEKKVGDYKFHKKIQYVWLVGLTIFVGIKKFIGL